MTRFAESDSVRVVAVPYARVSPLAWVALIVLLLVAAAWGRMVWRLDASSSTSITPSSAPSTSGPMTLPTIQVVLQWPTATATSTPVPTATALPTPVPLSARYPACDRATAPGTACWKHRLDVRTPTPIPDCTAVEGGLCVATGDESAHGRSETE